MPGLNLESLFSRVYQAIRQSGQGLLKRVLARPPAEDAEERERSGQGPAYMSLEGGQDQGDITRGCNAGESVGSVFQEDHKDAFLVRAFAHGLILPIHAPSGWITGPRRHHPLMITKMFDRSSPLLYMALIRGERFARCTIRWYRRKADDTLEHYFTHVMEDAVVVRMAPHVPMTQNPEWEGKTHLETVCFTYRSIFWKHEILGTEGTDNWRKR